MRSEIQFLNKKISATDKRPDEASEVIIVSIYQRAKC